MMQKGFVSCKLCYRNFVFADANECARDKDNDCHANATCTNKLGGYTCACKAGFTGGGKNCMDVNECARDKANDCHANTTCTNTIGSYSCACKAGFAGTDVNCKACTQPSRYSDGVGSAQCKQCPSGHYGATASGSNAKDGHTVCVRSTCRRPERLPMNSVILESKCPENGEQESTSTFQNASRCTLSCTHGFDSIGEIRPFICLADDNSTTASYQGGAITCAPTISTSTAISRVSSQTTTATPISISRFSTSNLATSVSDVLQEIEVEARGQGNPLVNTSAVGATNYSVRGCVRVCVCG